MTDPKVFEIRELRFKPANSNDRVRAGLAHDFKDVPPCSFAKDDGISPYMGSDSGISGFPDAPGTQAALLDVDIPPVKQEQAEQARSLAQKLLRGGFGLSVFLHAAAALAVGYMTISLPDEAVLNEGETVIAVEFFSETNSDVTTQVRRDEQEGEEIEEPVVERAETEPEPIKEPEKVEEPVEKKKVEQAKRPKPDKEPEKVEDPVITTDQPDVLASEQPSTFAVEQAAKQILDTSEIKPLPNALPDDLLTPVPVEEKKPELKLVQPLAHPVSRPRVVRKVAEAKPIEKPVEKKEEPKPVVMKPEPKKEALKKPEPKPKKQTLETDKKPVKKKVVQRDGNADSDNVKGRDTAKNKGRNSRDASDGGSNNREVGSAAVTNYKGLVQKRLERAKKRVSVAGKGSVTVSFTITASGSVTGLRVRKSSGKPAVDKGALDVVRKASPFPAIPPEAKRKSWSMSVPMTFR